CFMSITVPIAEEVVSMSGEAVAVTSTVSACVPTPMVAVIPVVFVACTETASNTCDLKPCFEILKRYVPTGRLTKVWVPPSWVWDVCVEPVATSTNWRSAPCTTLPLASTTTMLTLPSELCCAMLAGKVISQLTRPMAAIRKEEADLRDIRPPPRTCLWPPDPAESSTTCTKSPEQKTRRARLPLRLDFVYNIRSRCQADSCKHTLRLWKIVAEQLGEVAKLPLVYGSS